MKRHRLLFCSAALVIASCGRGGEQEQASVNEASNQQASTPQPAAPTPQSAAETNGTAPLSEPNGPIDPKSIEAAGQVVQSYGALIEEKRWSEADGLWGDAGAAAKFQSALAQFADVHLEIGNPGDPEGAAGSIYVTIPVIFYGDLKDGQPLRRSADVTLRRVNDVPGSAEAQRRWHIERIDWAS